MDEEMIEIKVKWNISKAMAYVFGALKESKLRIKKTKQYTASMEKLTKLYKLSQTQIWIICIACDKYIAFHDSCTMKDICNTLEISAMTIMTWRKDIELLIEKGFLEWQRIHDKFQPVSDFCDSLYNNIKFCKKGTLSDASITLSDKGKKLVLGEKAFLFEESIEVITGERAEISEIHEMCRNEKIESSECSRHIGFEL